MFGDFEAKVAEQQALLERLGTRARQGGSVAVDLGCGSGFQSIALARLGFRVLAIDFNRRLLDELNGRAAACRLWPRQATSATSLASLRLESRSLRAWAT